MLLLQVLTLSFILLTATVCGDENVQDGACEVNNNGSDPGQCLAAANVHSVEVEDAKAKSDDGSASWYRNISECKDNDPKCGAWAEKNECAGNPERMLRQCPKSCKVCDNEQRSGEYVANCYGEDQHVAGDILEKIAVRVQEVEDYMLQEVFVEKKYARIRAECKNRHKECSFWAVIGGKKRLRLI
jgi:hypothetical protein